MKTALFWNQNEINDFFINFRGSTGWHKTR